MLFRSLEQQNVNVQMISQGASKVNISMICNDEQADVVVKNLHKAYFSEN